MRELTCRLPHPPSLNRTYRTTRNGTHWYKTNAATLWAEESMIRLRAAGFKPQPEGTYWLALSCVLSTRRHDLDNVLKVLIDTVCAALAVDDRALGRLEVTKLYAARREDQAAIVRVTGDLAPAPDDFNRRSLDALGAPTRTSGLRFSEFS